ncbi:hypothetical protein CVT26_001348 [Gymnopilus dilepis]|uniref:Uncharacterized protein n=1 Tax=Gymnopilus dilepis TaxID=231916 RepID=A0A409YM16_9AGAR|nr:hypothetical protein CVT26_001348 [Gymnopilus dilepis]
MARKTKLSTNWVIRFVPNDVWRCIFHVISESSGHATPGILGVLRASHVCSSWRNVTENAPELWTNVVLEYCRRRKSIFPNVKLLSLFLSRSGNLPLTMEVTARKRPTSKEPLDVDALELFVGTMHRAKVLKVEIDALSNLCDYMEDIHSDDALVARVKPGLLLEKLEMSGGYESETSSAALANLWHPAPSMRTLAFYAFRADDFVGGANCYFLLSEEFPFQQITSLELTCPISHEGIYDLLPALPSLQSAILNYIHDVNKTVQRAVELQKLQTLSLAGPSYALDGEPPSMMKILEFISTPALTTLQLSFVGEWSSDSFKSFLSRAPTQIKKLHLDITEATDDERIDCLMMLPSLLTLDLTSKASLLTDDTESYLLEEDIMRAMTEWDDSRDQFVLCPHLVKLIIDYDTLDDTTTTRTAFVDMVESRWRRSSSGKGENRHFELVLKRAGHLGDSPKTISELMRLLLLRKAGLNLTIEPLTWLERLAGPTLPALDNIY